MTSVHGDRHAADSVAEALEEASEEVSVASEEAPSVVVEQVEAGDLTQICNHPG